MTPNARISAAAEILDRILAGEASEKALTSWARRSRFAGSGDRAAIRDLVFGALRQKRSAAWCGGAESGRGLMAGLLRKQDDDPKTYFSGDRFGLAPLTGEETERFGDLSQAPLAVRLDCPDWLLSEFEGSLGQDTPDVLVAMQKRAPVILRVNAARASRDAVADVLKAEGIETVPLPLSETALQVTENPRRVQGSKAYQEGLVELQDVASQAAVDVLARQTEGRVLDYCAGGGGKSLALAAAGFEVTAHDKNPARMKDLPNRAARAGCRISVVEQAEGRFDCVLCDAPCSGSGAWRRQVDAKWRLTSEMLATFVQTQAEILQSAQEFVRPGGVLAYMTCSLFQRENKDQIDRFLSDHDGWKNVEERQFSPLDGGDGFFVSVLRSDPN